MKISTLLCAPLFLLLSACNFYDTANIMPEDSKPSDFPSRRAMYAALDHNPNANRTQDITH